MTVFTEVYEIVGSDILKKARVFARCREVARDNQWELVKSLGAVGYRPGQRGTVSSLLFKGTIPLGFRKVGTDSGNTECKPRRNTKVGKTAAHQLADAPRVELWREFAEQFWNGSLPVGCKNGRSVIYFPTGIHIKKPRERFFLTYPRKLNDKWSPPRGLKLVRESDMLRAIEDHNKLIAK